MWGVIKWLISYILGGISFVAILVGAVWYLTLVYGSIPIGDPDILKRDRMRIEQESLKEAAKRNGPPDDLKVSIQGWLTVRRSFGNTTENGQDVLTNNPPDAVDNVNDHHNPSKLPVTTRIAQVYRTYREVSTKAEFPQDTLFVRLRGSLLFIDQVKDDCKSKVQPFGSDPDLEYLESLVVLNLERYKITIETRQGAAGLTEGKLFNKRSALVLRLVDSDPSKEKEGLPGMSSTSNQLTLDEEVAPWFLQCKTPVKTEDWYLKILSRTHAHPSYSTVWSQDHMKWFIKSVQEARESDPSNLDWLNAFAGRIFLGITHTSLVEQAICDRVTKKLTALSHPMIGPLVATEANLGHIPPTFSRVKLKELGRDGTISFQAHMDYSRPAGLHGDGIRITMEAPKIGFKAVLAIIIKSLSSDVKVLIKPPPSDRIWWAFTRPPKMDMVIEPVLGARQLNWSWILAFVDKKIRDAMVESVVLPNMDDLPFFNTMNMPVRGGIFNVASKYKANAAEETGSDSASIRSNKSDKSVMSVQTTHTSSTMATSVTQNSTSSAPAVSSSKHPGLRYRNNSGPHTVNEVLERKGPGRANTSPSVTQPTRKKAASSFRVSSSSRPSSVRTDSVATAATDSTWSVSDKPRTNSTDSSSARTADSPVNEATKSSPASLVERPVLSIQETNDTPRSLTPNERESLSTEVDRSQVPDPGTENVSGGVTGGVTTTSLMNAVRARDKAQLQTQANIAKEGIKKWGVNFVNNRRRPTPDTHPDEDGGAHAHHTSAYYAPSAEEREHQQQHALHHSPRTSLQDRLNAAAHANAATRRSDASTKSSTVTAVASVDSQDSVSSPSSSTPVSDGSMPTNGPLIKGVPRPLLPPRPAELHGTSPPASVQPPAARMVVPSVPKRAGVVTGIGHNPAATSPDAVNQVSAVAAKPSRWEGADSESGRVKSAPPDPEVAAYRALTPQPAVTARSVTARIASADGQSPARQSLLGHITSARCLDGLLTYQGLLGVVLRDVRRARPWTLVDMPTCT
ncbi:hypothetical protein CcaverHIS631_0700470 [Cutaneotrichosporon cavernicola]|nr:hypothetical protein CcaverHIS631_0700470 [Cutaneotrichosporon cavernicola]